MFSRVNVQVLIPTCILIKFGEFEVKKSFFFFFFKNRIELPHDPVIPLLGIYPKGLKAGTRDMFVHPCSQQY